MIIGMGVDHWVFVYAKREYSYMYNLDLPVCVWDVSYVVDMDWMDVMDDELVAIPVSLFLCGHKGEISGMELN